MQDAGDKIEPIWPETRASMIAEINCINQVLPALDIKRRNALRERAEILTMRLEGK